MQNHLFLWLVGKEKKFRNFFHIQRICVPLFCACIYNIFMCVVKLKFGLLKKELNMKLLPHLVPQNNDDRFASMYKPHRTQTRTRLPLTRDCNLVGLSFQHHYAYFCFGIVIFFFGWPSFVYPVN